MLLLLLLLLLLSLLVGPLFVALVVGRWRPCGFRGHLREKDRRKRWEEAKEREEEK